MDPSSIDIVFAATVLTAISLGSLIKGMTGLGLPLIGVPAIATFASVEEAVVLMIIPVLGSNLWLVASHRRFLKLLKEHLPFLIAGFAGGVAGTFLLVAVDDRWLKLLLAAWLAIYLLQYFLGDAMRVVFQARGVASALLGLTAGTVQGATGVSAHIVAPYFNGRDVLPQAYAFLIASAFLICSSAQLVTAASSELFTAGRAWLGILALVPVLLFTRIGIGLAGRVSKQAFQRLLVVLFVLMEIKLLLDVM